MKFIFDNFPTTFLGGVICCLGFFRIIIAAEQSVQLTATAVGILGIAIGFCIGIIYAAYAIRRN